MNNIYSLILYSKNMHVLKHFSRSWKVKHEPLISEALVNNLKIHFVLFYLQREYTKRQCISSVNFVKNNSVQRIDWRVILELLTPDWKRILSVSSVKSSLRIRCIWKPTLIMFTKLILIGHAIFAIEILRGLFNSVPIVTKSTNLLRLLRMTWRQIQIYSSHDIEEYGIIISVSSKNISIISVLKKC